MTKFLDDFSREVWENTYKDSSDQTIDDTLSRVAKAVASAEKNALLQVEYTNRFTELLDNFKMCAGGRILANAGTKWNGTTLMNCFVGPKSKYDQDSIEGILYVLRAQVLTLKSEGGWGMNFSFIRPRGSFIYGIGVESPGAVKYAELFNTSSDVITAGAGKKDVKINKIKGKKKIRKGAMMGILDCWHPDVEEWITSKLPFKDAEGNIVKRLQKFNLSVNCNNELMDRVDRIAEIKKIQETCGDIEHENLNIELNNLEQWDLVFPDTTYSKYKAEWDGNLSSWKSKGYPVKIYKTIKVSYLWDLIMKSTYQRNDPGVLFLDRANETHCWNYGGPEAYIAATNPCGEQCLPFGSVCNLASMNLTQFVLENGLFDFDSFAKYVYLAVRFLDNVNDLTNTPLTEYQESIRKRRRIGLGVMGWGSLLYMMKLRFASKEAENLKHDIMRVFTVAGVTSSIDLAKEKGMFEGCDPLKHSVHPFWKQINLPQSLIDEIAQHGIRNSALFSCQPTGNTGILVNIVSGGIEPVFSPEYIRTVIVDTCPPELLSLVPKYWMGEFKETETFKWSSEGEDKILRAEINGVVYKIDKNRGLTKEVSCMDYGVRWLKERNQWDENAPWAVTANTLSVEDHICDMKGFAKWIDSSISKTVNLASDYPYEKFQNLYLEAYKSRVLKGITTYRANTTMNVLAVKTEVPSEKKKTNTIKDTERPTSVPADLHHFVIDGKKYYVAVGLFNDTRSPYEVFTGINETKKEIFIPKVVRHGAIIKKRKGKYVFAEDNEEYELTNGHSDPTADALSRVISCALQAGADIAVIVHRLEKTDGPITCFSKALTRTLKKYIKDGTMIDGEECPECHHQLVRQEGCCVCPSCGFSKCA